MQTLHRLVVDDGASTATEYALIATIVSVGIIVGLTAYADAAGNLWTYLGDTILAAIR